MKTTKKVGYVPSKKDTTTPQITIGNKTLSEYGFNVGDSVEVEYQENKITIKKI